MSTEHEKSLLAACLIDADALVIAQEHVAPHYFNSARDQDIFAAMIELDEDGTPVDLVTMNEKVEDITYLMELTESLPSAARAEHYAKMVSGDYRKRETRKILHEAMVRADNGDEPLDIVSSVDKKMSGVLDSTREGARHIADLLIERGNDYDAMQKGEGISGFTSGFPALDHILGGFQPGEQTVLAARPGMGKSALAVNIAVRAAAKGVKVAIFSMEMGGKTWVDRALADVASIDASSLRRGTFGEEGWIRVTNGMAKLHDLPLWVDDTATTLPEIRGVARRLAQRNGLDLVIVDYLGLLSDAIPAGENKVGHIGHLAKTLRSMGKDYGGSMLLLHQLSRSSVKEGRKPRLDDLRDSGEIEQHADVVWFLHPDPDRSANMSPGMGATDLIIAKHRHGETADLGFVFEGKYTRFTATDYRR